MAGMDYIFKFLADTSGVDSSIEGTEASIEKLGKEIDKALDMKNAKANIESAFKAMNVAKAQRDLIALRKNVKDVENEYKSSQKVIIDAAKAVRKAADEDERLNAKNKAAGIIDPKLDEERKKLEGAAHALEDLAGTIDGIFAPAIEEANGYLDKMGEGLAELQEQTPLRKQLKDVREELQQLAISGQENTEEFAALQQQGANLVDTIGDINGSLKAMSTDEKVFSTLNESLQLFAGGLSTTMGVMSLFTNDESKMVEMQKNLQSVIAITTGLQSIQNALNKDGNIISKLRILTNKLVAKSELQVANATGQATVKQKLLNLAVKANPYVLLISVLAAAGAALYAFASKTANAKKAQADMNREVERTNKLIEQQSRATKRNIEIAKAQGMSDEDADREEYNALAIEAKKRYDLLVKFRKKRGGKYDKDQQRWKYKGGGNEDIAKEDAEKDSELEKAYLAALEAAKDAETTWTANSIKRQRDYQDEVTRLTQQANAERAKMQASYIKNRIARIKAEENVAINAIKREQKEFEKAQKQKGITKIDTSSFSTRINVEISKAKKEIELIKKEWSDRTKETNLSAEAKMLETENSLLRRQAELIDDENARTEALRAVRRKEHEERLKQITAERDAQLKALAEEGVDETTEEGKNLIAAVNKEANTKAYAENSMYTLNEQKEDIERIKQAAQESIDIERGRLEEIDKLREMHKEGVITDKELEEGTAQVNANAAVEQKSVADRLGMTQEEITAVLQTVADSVLNASFEQIDTMLTEAEAHLAEIQAEGGEDSGEDLTALKLKIDALKLAKDRAKKNGSVADALAGNNSKKKMKEITSSVSDLADALEECGDSIGGTAGQAMKVMGNVLASSITVITGIQQVVNTSTEGTKKAATTAETAIKTVETASVILAVISAAIQAAQQIMSLFDNDSEREEYEKAKAQYEDYISVLDAVIDKQLELAETASGEAASELYDASVEYAEKAAEAARKMGHDYVRSGADWNSRSEGYKQDDNLTKEARREAEAVIKELGLNVTVSDLAGKSGKIFDLTADQIRKFMEESQLFYSQLRGDTKEYLNQILKSAEQIEETEQRKLERYSNTTFDEMKDNFKSALGEMGEDVEDFSKSIQETLKDAILSNIIDKEFKEKLDKLQQDMAAYNNDKDGINEAEYGEIMRRAELLDDEIKRRRAELAQTYQGLIDETTTQEGTSKGFEAMSQDTANELNGRFTALQITGANIDNKMTTLVQEAAGLREDFTLSVGIANNMLLELRGINANTALIADTNVRLRNIEEVLEDRL